MIIIYILVILVILYFIWKFYFNNEIVSIKSKVDNNKYIIRSGNKSHIYLEESADTLAVINMRIEKLLNHLKQKYNIHDEKNLFLLKLIENYSPKLLSEAANDNRFTTFTIDKKDMHICLRTRDGNDKMYDINILMYVILHELAHFCNYDKNGNAIIGHGKEFKSIFRLLVTESINIGVYEYINFVKNPSEYCGIIINTTII